MVTSATNTQNNVAALRTEQNRWTVVKKVAGTVAVVAAVAAATFVALAFTVAVMATPIGWGIAAGIALVATIALIYARHQANTTARVIFETNRENFESTFEPVAHHRSFCDLDLTGFAAYEKRIESSLKKRTRDDSEDLPLPLVGGVIPGHMPPSPQSSTDSDNTPSPQNLSRESSGTPPTPHYDQNGGRRYRLEDPISPDAQVGFAPTQPAPQIPIMTNYFDKLIATQPYRPEETIGNRTGPLVTEVFGSN